MFYRYYASNGAYLGKTQKQFPRPEGTYAFKVENDGTNDAQGDFEWFYDVKSKKEKLISCEETNKKIKELEEKQSIV